MSGRGLRVLLVQPWTSDPAPLTDSLRAAGLDPTLTRVDFEAALAAALAHDRFDVVVYDPSTRELPRDVVASCIDSDRRNTPVVVLEDLAAIGVHVLQALSQRRN